MKKNSILHKIITICLFTGLFLYFPCTLSGQDNNTRPLGPPPGGPPPGGGKGGFPPQGMPGMPPGNSSPYKLDGTYMLNNGNTVTEENKKVTSDKEDVSAIWVTKESKLILNSPLITTTGESSSADNSSFFGLNAAVLATEKSEVNINGGEIITSGLAANGLFAVGEGSVVTMTGGKIHATGGNAHGVMATLGGTVVLNDVNIYTRDQSAAAIATDRGSGTIDVSGGYYETEGFRSPAIYSTGQITVNNATFIAKGAEAIVIEGENTVTSNNSTLEGNRECGAMIYQSFSGDAEGRKGKLDINGGEFTCSEGPLLYVTNAEAEVCFNNVKTNADSGILAKVSQGNWGVQGSNGGHLKLSTKNQHLKGDIMVDAISSATIFLQENSILAGKITNASVILDKSSKWEVTAESVITGFTNSDGISGNNISNITGNGFTVYYDSSADGNQSLNGKTYTLVNGGSLTPLK